MSHSKLITAIGEELECPVCAEYFTDACFLSCMHTFCRSCLRKCDKTYGRGGKTSMSCPLCRKVTYLGRNGIDALASDFTSNKLVTRLKESIEERNKCAGNMQHTAVTCQSCQGGTIVAYCLSCCHFICTSCQSLHSKLSPMTTHEVVPLRELRKGNVTVVRAEKPQFCSVHREDTVFFCYPCQRYHCKSCCNKGHSCTEQSHNEDGEPMAKRKKEAIQKSVEKLSNNINSISEEKSRVKRLRAKVKRQFGEMKHQLEKDHVFCLGKITRVLKEKHDDLAKEMRDDQDLILSKIASVDENLGHAESRTLEAKAIGDNAIKDGQHAEITFVNEYLDSVISSLNEDDSAEDTLTQIEEYAKRVTLKPVPADSDVGTLASLGKICRPPVWDKTTVSRSNCDFSTLTSIQFDCSQESFLVSSATTIGSIDRRGKFSHICNMSVHANVKDMAISEDGLTKYLLFQDNRIRIFQENKWGQYSGVIEIPGENVESVLSSVAVNHSGTVVVGDQASQTVVGCKSYAFEKMTNISPVQMTFTGCGDLVVVCRNINYVKDDEGRPWNQAGVVVRIFGGDERRVNVIMQENWQAAAVSSSKEKGSDRFFAFAIYVFENGRQLTSLAEYDRFGIKKETIFEDKELPVDLENGVKPLIAADSEGSSIAVFTGKQMYVYHRLDFNKWL